MKLVTPEHDQNRLPVLLLQPNWQSGRFQGAHRAARTSLQVVTEFRSKMRMAEDLIAKLEFSLREIQGTRKRPKHLHKPVIKPPALVIQIDTERFTSQTKL